MKELIQQDATTERANLTNQRTGQLENTVKLM